MCPDATVPMLKNPVFRFSAVLLFLTLFYCVIFQKDRPFDIDNSWFLSFSYNLCNQHIQTDEMWRVRFPNGMDGTHLFGKTAALSQCLVLNQWGWMPRVAESINITLIVVSLSLWWASLKSLGFDTKFATYFILLLGLARPTVLMAETFRYEFFAFFLFSVALYLAVRRLEFAACLIAMFTVETEPAAILVFLFIGLILIARSNRRLLLGLQALAASLIVGAIYFKMHPDSFYILKAGTTLGSHSVPGSFLYHYYLKDPRHWPDLIVLGTGNALYLFNKRRNINLPLATASITLLSFFILFPHSNPYYLAFAYPCWLMAALLGSNMRHGFSGSP